MTSLLEEILTRRPSGPPYRTFGWPCKLAEEQNNMSQKMRARMTIQTITKNSYSEIVEFSCVYGGTTNKEDNSFAAATPSGSSRLQLDNKELHGKFAPGDTFYVDFTPVPKS